MLDDKTENGYVTEEPIRSLDVESRDWAICNTVRLLVTSLPVVLLHEEGFCFILPLQNRIKRTTSILMDRRRGTERTNHQRLFDRITIPGGFHLNT